VTGIKDKVYRTNLSKEGALKETTRTATLKVSQEEVLRVDW